ncbi:MAG: ribonuclease J [Pseudomonadota bacterium]
MALNFKEYDDDVLFLPLGGANEIGMNLNLYRYKGKWLMIDLGIGFAGHHLPGIDIVVPNIDAITPYKNDIVGLVLTHAHEDHLGAVAYLWPEIGCPIYATPFTAAVLKNKLAEEGLQGRAKVHEIKAGVQYDLGPFGFEMVPVTHSIPEMHAVAVRTDKGVIMHTGDWKLDDEPMVGVPTDEATLGKYGDEGVLAMICDSTNVFVEGESGSEADVRVALSDIIKQCPNRAVVTTFSSNIARLETIIYAARDAGRSVAIAGKSIWRMVQAARDAGYLKDAPTFLTDAQGMECARDKVVFICTGCQGESRAALSKIARGEHPGIRLSPGDSVIFSSRTIPGNEANIGYMVNKLVSMGMEVINDRTGFIHVSGHPCRNELKRMYELVRPKIAVPVHGEARHIHEHALFARELNVPVAIEPTNGVVINLTAAKPGIIGKVEWGYIAIDGTSMIDSNSSVVRTRRKIRDDGFVIASLMLTQRGELAGEPMISAPGCLDNTEDKDLIKIMRDEVAAAVAKAHRGGNKGKMLDETIRNGLRKIIRDELGKKPVLDVHIHHIA